MIPSVVNAPEFLRDWAFLYPVLIMLPGPDTAAVAQHSLRHGWRSGLACAQGMGLGLCACLLVALVLGALGGMGLGVALAFLVGAYFGYCGAQSLRINLPGVPLAAYPDGPPPTLAQARRSGFLNTVLNVKVAAYLGLLLLGAFAARGAQALVLAGLAAALWHLLWFYALAWVLSRPRARQAYQHNALRVDQALGLLWLLHGLINMGLVSHFS